MAGPFDVQIVAEIEGGHDTAALKFVDNGPVVNAVNRDFAAVPFIEEAPSFFPDLRDAYGAHSKHAFGGNEIRQRFLMQRIDFHQDHIFRIVTAEDGPAQQCIVASQVKAGEQIAQVRIQAVGVYIQLRKHRLVGVQRGERLNLDQAWRYLSGGFTHQAEIHLEEEGVVRFARHVELRRHGLAGNSQILE